MADNDAYRGAETPHTELVPPGHGEEPQRVPNARDTLIVRISALVVLALGIAAISLASVFNKDVPRDTPTDDGALVELQELTSGPQNLVVRAQGSVVPSRDITIHAEVSGRIEWVSSELVPGGRLKKGQEIVRIDARDYRLRSQQAAASLEQAQYKLQIEQSRKKVAEREWSMIGSDSIASAEGKAVALREPQLKAAEAAVEAAESAAELARVQLARSTIRAPFASFVQTEHTDVGQFVSPQQPVATLIGMDEFRVQVSIPMDDLARIKVPGWWNVKDGEGSKATIWTDLGGQRVERAGEVTGLLGDLDPVGRMARIIVTIQDPFDLKRDAKKGADSENPMQMPLLVGSYVHVEINTGAQTGLIEVPRTAVFEGNKIYVFEPVEAGSSEAKPSDAEGASQRRGKLEVRKVDIEWTRPKSLLVSSGVSPGESVVVSRIPSPLPGMKLRAASPKAADSDTTRDARGIVVPANTVTDRPASGVGSSGQAAAATKRPNGNGAAVHD